MLVAFTASGGASSMVQVCAVCDEGLYFVIHELSNLQLHWMSPTSLIMDTGEGEAWRLPELSSSEVLHRSGRFPNQLALWNQQIRNSLLLYL